MRKETSKSVEYQGKRVSGKQALAFMALDGLINGEVKFANGVKILLSEEGWLSLFKFIHTHLDGPVKPDPEPLDVVTWSPDEWRKEAARRHGEASDTMATFDDLDAQDGE